MRCH